MSLTFNLINDNPNTWGPSNCATELNIIPAYLSDIPFQSFNKGERLTKVADWSATTTTKATKTSAVTSFFNTNGDGDEEEFKLVDNRSVRSKKKPLGQRGPLNKRVPTPYQTNKNAKPGHFKRNPNAKMNHNRKYVIENRKKYEPSVAVNPEWGDPLVTLEFAKLSKAKSAFSLEAALNKGTTLLDCGQLYSFNTQLYRNINPKMETVLDKSTVQGKTFPRVTSSDDPNLKKFAANKEAQFFITDGILSLIMSCYRTFYSWDIVVTKKGDTYFFDRRKGDAVTVNENSAEPPHNADVQDTLNNHDNLCNEASLVSQAFLLSSLQTQEPPTKFKYTNPFGSTSQGLAPTAYLYKKLPLGDSGKFVVVRCEIEGVVKNKADQQEYTLIKTLQEYSPKITGDWRKKLETSRGSVVSMEYKNNAAKMCRWACQAVLAGAKQIQLGFISRKHPMETATHHLLAVDLTTTDDLTSHMGLNYDQMWGVFMQFVETVQQFTEDGKYLIFHEPAMGVVKFYKMPTGVTTDAPVSNAQSFVL